MEPAGRNGHGKTTLFRIIIGEEEIDTGVISIPKAYSIGHVRQAPEVTEDTVCEDGCRGLPAGGEMLRESFWERLSYNKTFRPEKML